MSQVETPNIEMQSSEHKSQASSSQVRALQEYADKVIMSEDKVTSDEQATKIVVSYMAQDGNQDFARRYDYLN